MKHVIFEDRMGSTLPDYIFSLITEIHTALMQCLPFSDIDQPENRVLLRMAHDNCYQIFKLIQSFKIAHDQEVQPYRRDVNAGIAFNIVNRITPEGVDDESNNS